MPKLSALSDTALTKLYEILREKHMVVVREFCAVGRGNERHNTIWALNDPLAQKYRDTWMPVETVIAEQNGQAKYGSRYYRKNLSDGRV